MVPLYKPSKCLILCFCRFPVIYLQPLIIHNVAYLSAFRFLMFFQDLMGRRRLTARLQLASHVARLKQALCSNCSLPCHILTGLPHATHQSTHPAAALTQPGPFQTANDLNSKNTFTNHIWKNKKRNTFNSSYFCFSSYPTYSAKKHFTFIFTPSLYLPVAGSGSGAPRAETKPDTHTAHSHYTGNFPQKALLTSISRLLWAHSLSHVCTKNTHWTSFVLLRCQSQSAVNARTTMQNKTNRALWSASVGGVSLARQFPWQHTGDSPVCDAVAVTTCGVLHHYGSGEHCGCVLSWVLEWRTRCRSID